MDVHSPFLRFYFLCGHCGVKPQVEESHHHFIPTLLSPYHAFGWVWVFGIVRRIIEMGGAFDFSPLREGDGLGEVVPQLPMPVESWNAQDGFFSAIGEYQSVFERFPARVHVGMNE